MSESDDRTNDRGSDAEEATDLHERFYSVVLSEVERERFPSNEILDLLETRMTSPDREQIANLLMDKVAAQRYPSLTMLRRIARLAG